MVFYDSWLAKKLLADGSGIIMLFGMIFTEFKKEFLENSGKVQTMLAHEKVHVQQFLDCTLVTTVLASIIMELTGWWPVFFFVPTFYYVLYVIEFVVRYVYSWFKFRHLPVRLWDYAYKMVSFEQHASDLEKEWKLPSDVKRPTLPFGWMKFMLSF